MKSRSVPYRLALIEAEQARREGWRRIIDEVLIEWGRSPERIEDDGIDAPTAAAMAGASRVACRMRDDKMPLPSNVAPVGDGGIALQYEFPEGFLTIEIDTDGAVELRVFRDGE